MPIEWHPLRNISQRTALVLDVNGAAVWTFDKPFPGQPVVSLLYHELAANQPIILKVVSFQTNGPFYTGLTIQAYRSQVVPQNLVTQLLSNPVNIYAGGNLLGIVISALAIGL